MKYQFSYRLPAEALYMALTEDAFYITMEQSVADGSAREAMIRYMDFSMVEAERYGVLLIAADQQSGAAVWSRPLTDEEEEQKSKEKRDFISQHMGRTSLERYDEMVAFMAGKTIPQIEPESWYLSIIGLHPGSQGKGLGAGLIDPILQKTDRLQQPTYLETFTPRTISFYERLGYRSLDRIHEPTSGADYWLMVREARLHHN